MEQKSKESQFCLNHKISGEGIRDVDPSEVKSNSGNLALIDVRRPDEYTGDLGHIAGARLVTLETELAHFLSKATEQEKSQPTVFICRSGGRSTRAALIALQSGFKDVYNMTGGMIYWNELKFPTAK
jgi:rhodanese-related sulfurtransferase